MSESIGFGEGPPGNPVVAANTCAILGFCSGAAPSSDPTHPNVIPIDSPGQVAAAGYGEAPELAHLVSRRGKKRCLIVPTTASLAGVIGAVTQVGMGPLVTATALGAGPFDNAAVAAKIVDAGPAGVATVALSWSYSVSNGIATPLYQGKITVPARAPASVTGGVDLTTITYAKVAQVTGTVDLTAVAITYGPGGTFDAETLSLNLEGAGAIVTTFAAPVNAAGVVSQINVAMGALVASLNNQGQLVLVGTVPGVGGSIVTGAGGGGTSYAGLGLTAAHTTLGTAGTLDGETLLFGDDAGAGQTVTFSGQKPTGPADVLAKINAATGVTASLFGSKNLLRLVSKTNGSTSTLAITGGTGRVVLGLPLVAATGVESTYDIAHLGVRVTFGSGSNGTFAAGTLYTLPVTAPKCSDADLVLRIADLVASGYSFGAIYVASEVDVVSSLARAIMLDAQVTALHLARKMKRAAFGLAAAELDADIKSTFTGFTSAWVDRFARGAYVRASSNILGGGNILRSSSWLGAVADTFLPYWKDRGDHTDAATYDAGIVGLPDVDGITADEASVTTPLVSEVNSNGTSCNVLTKGDDNGYYFAGGYTSTAQTSSYCDASTRNVLLRGAEVASATLAAFQNDTSLDTNEDGTLTSSSAGEVDGAVEMAIESDMMPAAIQGVKCVVDTTIDFYHTKKLSARITLGNRVPARVVGGIIGPGLIPQ